MDHPYFEVETKQYIKSFCVNFPTFLPAYEDPGVKVSAHLTNKMSFSISSLAIHPGLVTDLASRDIIDRMHSKLEATYSGFPIRGDAFEFSDSNHGFRVYRPAISPLPDGGFFFTVKVDHLRENAVDDYAILAFNIDKTGMVRDIVTPIIKIQNDQWLGEIVNVVSDVLAKLPEEARKNPKVVAAEAAAAGAAKIYEQLLKITDYGGRDVFANQVKHQSNNVLTSIIDAINER